MIKGHKLDPGDPWHPGWTDASPDNGDDADLFDVSETVGDEDRAGFTATGKSKVAWSIRWIGVAVGGVLTSLVAFVALVVLVVVGGLEHEGIAITATVLVLFAAMWVGFLAVPVGLIGVLFAESGWWVKLAAASGLVGFAFLILVSIVFAQGSDSPDEGSDSTPAMLLAELGVTFVYPDPGKKWSGTMTRPTQSPSGTLL